MNDINFLSLIMKKIHDKRPRLSIKETSYNRIEQTKAGCSANVWFMTKGCQWDSVGGCTMCNYGRGFDLNEQEIINAVKQGLSALPNDVSELFLSPSGSLIDPQEVPPIVRQEIYKLINKHSTDYFAFETRAEFINKEALDEIKRMISNKNIGIEIGLESANPWIRKFCINKGNQLEDFINAAQLIKKYDFECLANVSLGTAFLTPREALSDAVNSSRWALENGAHTVVLFPMHVKPYTLLEWLYKKGYYKPPTLWMFIEALYNIGPENINNIDISWYKSGYSDESKIIASPDSCDKCKPTVYNLLDKYRKTRDFDIVYKLHNFKCGCKQMEDEATELQKPLKERIFEIYSILAEDFELTHWFKDNRNNLMEQMEAISC